MTGALPLPRFEVFGEPEPLRQLIQELRDLADRGEVARLELEDAPRPDPADGALRHTLTAWTQPEAAEQVWDVLYRSGVRAWRCLTADAGRAEVYGVLVGPAPPGRLEAALRTLEQAGAQRLIYLAPPGAPLDTPTRAVLRGRARILTLGAAADDPDQPPERIEATSLVIRCTAPLPSAQAALALLNKQEPRLLITPHRSLSAVSQEGSRPLEAGELTLGTDARTHLGVGPLREGLVLCVAPQRARWITVGRDP